MIFFKQETSHKKQEAADSQFAFWPLTFRPELVKLRGIQISSEMEAALLFVWFKVFWF